MSKIFKVINIYFTKVNYTPVAKASWFYKGKKKSPKQRISIRFIIILTQNLP